MPLKFRCACGAVLKTPDSMAGKWVTCPGCRALTPVANYIRVPPKKTAAGHWDDDPNAPTEMMDLDDLPPGPTPARPAPVTPPRSGVTRPQVPHARPAPVTVPAPEPAPAPA